MESSKDIDLLLIGKTGNGKSALGNTILRRNLFISKNSQTSVTKDVKGEVSEVNNRVIKVVDGPGVGDTCLDREGAVNLVLNAMQLAILANPRGYHAFLLVTKFGGRFTEEDKETIQILKRIFGEHFVKNYCILVLTCGDNFYSDENNTSTFEEWCNEQIGVFKELLEECNHRVVLFDNRTKEEDKKEKQLSKLIEMVDNLRWRDLRYTDENFQKAREAREKLMVEAKKPMVREETMNETSLIIQKLQWIQENVDHKERLSHLDGLQKRATTLYDKIHVEDKGTGALHDILHTVNSIQVTITNEIEISQRVIEEKEKMRKVEEERTQTFMAELARQRKEYEQRLKQDKIEGERRSRLLEEYEKKLRVLTEKNDKDREDREKAFQKPFEEESRLQRKQLEDIETQYKAAKQANDEGFFSSFAKKITLPFRKLFGIED
ncbi:unnamed protein product [Lymnaea stagnalis]|uniref:AIG1-type G domain-containing protein n=1 Tax=Lymnaea stagnalis TaxID=6523 RepID=A0AAV2IAF1_LYMST